jgi:hypothetical protein
VLARFGNRHTNTPYGGAFLSEFRPMRLGGIMFSNNGVPFPSVLRLVRGHLLLNFGESPLQVRRFDGTAL